MSQQLQEFGQTSEAEQTVYTRFLTMQAATRKIEAALKRQYFISEAQAPVTVPTPEIVAAPVMSQEVAPVIPMRPVAPAAETAPLAEVIPIRPEISAASEVPAPPVEPSVEQLSQNAYDLAA